MDVIDKIMADYEKRLASPHMRSLARQAKKANANYGAAYRYSIDANNALNASLAKYAKEEDIEMKYDILEAFFGRGMKREYDAITQITESVQNSVNRNGKIGLRAIKPKFNKDKVQGMTKYFTRNVYDADVINDIVLKRIRDYTENFSMSIVDDAIKANAEFQSDNGFKAIITRIASPDACEWCANLAGVYNYDEVKETHNPVFMRHRNCTCEVLYTCERDKHLNVHDKRTEYNSEQVDRMIEYSKKTNAAFYSKSDVQKRKDLAAELEKRIKR